MTRPADSQPTPATPRRWFQFSLRAALWVMVTLGVGLGWLSDRAKLQQQIAQERAENDGLRAARDFDNERTGQFNPWTGGLWLGGDLSGWSYPLVTTGAEPDEATVEHLKQYLGGDPVYLAGTGGGAGYRG